MKKTTLSFLAISLLTLTALEITAAAESAPALKPFADNTKYVAIGDSITHGGWYIRYIDFFYLTRFPQQHLFLTNSGANGEAAYQLMKRYPFEVAPLHPDVVSIMYGMNDAGLAFYIPGAKFAEPLDTLKARGIDTYEKSLKGVIQQLLKDKLQVIMITPSPYDDTATGRMRNCVGYNAALAECAVRAKKIAQELGVPLIDFYTPMQKINLEKQAHDPAYTIVGMDRIHPGPIGHLVMAYTFLKAQNVPGDVARFSIKGTDGSVQSTVNCQIDQAKVTDHTLTFRYSAKSLPFPFVRWVTPALKLVPFTEELNREVFQVTDLAKGTYELQIDDKPIRTYTAEELGAGVNLSEEPKTPQYQQAMKAWLIHEKEFDCWVKIRDLSSHERNQFDPKVPRPISLEQVNQRMDELEKANAGKPGEEKIKKVTSILRDLKAHEVENHATMEKLSEELRPLVIPLPHMVKIRLVNAQ